MLNETTQIASEHLFSHLIGLKLVPCTHLCVIGSQTVDLCWVNKWIVTTVAKNTTTFRNRNVNHLICATSMMIANIAACITQFLRKFNGIMSANFGVVYVHKRKRPQHTHFNIVSHWSTDLIFNAHLIRFSEQIFFPNLTHCSLIRRHLKSMIQLASVLFTSDVLWLWYEPFPKEYRG